MALERSNLRVEGLDDRHALVHLLIRNGIDYEQRPWAAWLPSIEEVKGGKPEVLANMERLVRASSNKQIGFVLDADNSVKDTWSAIRSRLLQVGVDLPPALPIQGFVGESSEYRARVGVWLMPDNEQEGAHGEGTLERFLETLVSEADPLLPYASEATQQAKTKHGAKYRDVDVRKAELHAWLAWQEEPGLPYGTAIKARYFRHDTPVATRFVAWFRRLFEDN